MQIGAIKTKINDLWKLLTIYFKSGMSLWTKSTAFVHCFEKFGRFLRSFQALPTGASQGISDKHSDGI